MRSNVWSGIACSVGERGQRVAAELLGYPAFDGLGTDAAIELDRGRVPVQHVPLHVDAVALEGDAGHVAEEGEADTAAAMGRVDVDVFDEQAVAAGEGAEGEEPEGEADGFLADIDKDRGVGGIGAEHRLVQTRFGDLEAVLELLVGREVAHQAMQRRDVAWRGRAESEGHSNRLSGSSTIRLNSRSQRAPRAPSTTR